MMAVYLTVLALLSLYSYSLLDPNITIVTSDLWTQFRNTMVQFGYYQRTDSTIVFFILVALLGFFHLFFMRNVKRYSPWRVAILTSVILLCSYPFLSHDVFNYMFDAKILTFYHQNPYLHQGLDFPHDQWLRFMHWTHRSYPYGPTFLPLTLVPSFLGFGKFAPTLLLFKVLFAGSYLMAVRSMEKVNKNWAMFIATHPLIIIEGLVNNHNDLIALSLGLVGVSLLWRGRVVAGRVLLLLSGGIKYMTLPLLLLVKDKNSKLVKVSILLVVLILVYLAFYMEVQPWYFLSLFAFIPYIFTFLQKLFIFFVGLLVSYYPFILYGTWGESKNVMVKHEIIIGFAIINVLFLIFENKKAKLLKT